MDKPEMITITLVYARNAEQQFLSTLNVPLGSTVEQAIMQSGVCAAYEEIDLAKNQVGLSSKVVTLDTVVEAGDRIEIYRPLIFDPMNARRLRAQNQPSKKS